MPPMRRRLMTAWASVSHMSIRLELQDRCAGVFLRKHAGEIAVLPLHADRPAVDVLAIGAEFDVRARSHRGVAGGDIERRQGFADFLRIGGTSPVSRRAPP